MGFSLFISDLHLCESRPEIVKTFLAWLNQAASKADALYILGDFFEYWAGDDAIDAHFHQPILQALKQLHAIGVSVYLMHGNRDFLIAEHFQLLTQVKLLSDPSEINLYGNRVLISHGDALCTDDVDYMQFRQQVRQPAWQAKFLSQSIATRQAFIAEARNRSEQEKSIKRMDVMDVNADAVERLIRSYQYPPILIHGHTHRPKCHHIVVDGYDCQRWVLGDWYEQGSALEVHADGQIKPVFIF